MRATSKRVAPYGSWPSPVSAAMVARGATTLAAPHASGEDLYWLEGRPQEDGRQVVVRRSADGGTVDVTPPGYSGRTRVHEYGGGSYLVTGTTVVFSNFSDQRLYRQDSGEVPAPLTPEPPEPGSLRYADGRATRDFVICVRETHDTSGGGATVRNELVAVPLDGRRPIRELVSGSDFVSFPRPSPEGRRLAWTSWDHPQMPWDGTHLWVGDLGDDLTLSGIRHVAGGEAESVFQPEWDPEGVLHFVSDRTGWWNLYREVDGVVVALAPMAAEFGEPQWVFGLSTYTFVGGGHLVCKWTVDGLDHLGVLTGPGPPVPLDLPFTEISSLQAMHEGVVFLGATPTEPRSVVAVAFDATRPSDARYEVLRRVHDERLDPDHVSRPQPVEFAASTATGIAAGAGSGTGQRAHALYYPPVNAGARGPEGSVPPLLVMSHGGPTSAATASFNLAVQFWTTRGIAVVDVNYRGSTGYGRAYRDALKEGWGVVDVDDCVAAATHLVDEGLVDGRRLAIRGGSAGGFTTLCAVTFREGFAAGASYYGVADPARLAADTHKFESHYLDGLIGPWPEAADRYRERSPIHHVARLSTPLIVFQGLDDPVVPPNQAELMVSALDARHVPHAYLAFAGEQHGFRRAATIRRCLEAELYFYAGVLGFPPPTDVEPVSIKHL